MTRKTAVGPPHRRKRTTRSATGRAVQREIAKDRRIKPNEARLIHALLRGRAAGAVVPRKPMHRTLSPMNLTVRKPMTLAEFLAWEERQEQRYEFDGSEPVAMAGGSLCRSRWRSEPDCVETHASSSAATSRSRSADNSSRYPDGMVDLLRS